MKYEFVIILFFLFCLENSFAQEINREVEVFELMDEALGKSNARLEYNIKILNNSLGLHFLGRGMVRNLKGKTPEEQQLFDALREFEVLVEMIDYGRDFLTDLIGREIEEEEPITKDNTKVLFKAFQEVGFAHSIEASVKKAKAAFEKVIDGKNRKEIFEVFPMNPTTPNSNNEFQSWMEYTFKDLSLVGGIALLNKIKNDALAAKYQLLMQLAEENDQINFNPLSFEVYQLIAKNNGQLLNLGESYETDIQLVKKVLIMESTGVYFPRPKDGNIRNRGGQPRYLSQAIQLGENPYTIKSVFSNPMLGTKDTIENEFSYIVGTQKSPVYLVPQNSDELYIGIKNRVHLFSTGVDIGNLEITSENCEVEKVYGSLNLYEVKPKELGVAKITLKGNEIAETEFEFEVVKSPNPIADIYGLENGEISHTQVRGFSNLGFKFESPEYQFSCQRKSFEFSMITDGKISEKFTAGKYGISGDASTMMRGAKAGDILLFEKIKCQCEGDKEERQIEDLVVRLK